MYMKILERAYVSSMLGLVVILESHRHGNGHATTDATGQNGSYRAATRQIT